MNTNINTNTNTNTNTDTFTFQIIDWNQHYDDESDKKKFIIQLFGKTKQGESVYTQINNYKPYFYIKLQPEWRKAHVIKILSEIRKKVYSKDIDKKELIESLTEWHIIDKYDFYGFTNAKVFNFLHLIFDSFEGMRAYASAFDQIYKLPFLSRDPIKFKLYESNILPMLRYMHERDLQAVGWISIPRSATKPFDGPPPTCCTHNFQTNHTQIQPVDDCLIAPLIICAFDLECKSQDGTFPQPQRDDPIIQIGLTFSLYGANDCYEKIILCLRKTSSIPDATVLSFDDEADLLLEFSKILRQKDPDIITGYNIFGFDFKYLMKRAEKLGILTKFSRLSRINGEVSEWVEQELNSAALGQNIMCYYKMTGRIIIDLMKVVQRDYKLSSYKLDYVASYFIKEVVLDISHNQHESTFTITTKNTFGISVGQYITITYVEGGIDNSYGDGQKFKVLEITPTTLTVEGQIRTDEFMDKGYKVSWCQAKDDISPNDIFRMFDQTPDDRAIIAKYCLQDCVLCNKLMAKLQIINNNVSMANVCNVPLSYLFFRGQGVKIFSLVAKKCRKKHHLIPVIKKKKEKVDVTKLDLNDPKDKKIFQRYQLEQQYEKAVRDANNKDRNHEDEEIGGGNGGDGGDGDDDGYEGAIVFIPQPKVYYEPVPVLDFASLYPNAMRLRNLSHECYVNDPAYDNLPGFIYHSISYKNNNGTFTTCRFAENKNGTKGIIPEILTDLLTARKKYKKLMEEEKEPFKKAILDSLQLAYKITANSLYGQCGSSLSPIYMKEIAASTTSTGREMLLFSKYFIENVYDTLIGYALTDKERFYEEMRKVYECYPHHFNVVGEDGKPQQLHVHTLENVKIPGDKFVRGEVGYEFGDAKTPTEVVKFLSMLSPFQRDQLVKAVEKREKGEKEIFEKYTTFWQKNGVNCEDELELLLEKESYLKYLKLQVENTGYDGKEQFIDKAYITFRKLLKGKTLKANIIYGDTDSVFFKCTITDIESGKVIKDKEALEIAINLGIWASIMICTILPAPMAQEYEKVLWPFAIQGKKRYVGNLYEKNPKKYYQKSMGIEIKRRDNAPIVKYVCIGIIDQILNKHSPEGAHKFAADSLHNIITGKYKMDKFVISKTIKGPGLTAEERKVENEREKDKRYYVDRSRIVHAVLADRIADRTPGNQPQSNDRIPFVYIETKKEPKLQGDKVETPDYIVANKLKIDYLFYITNQIMKPSLKFLDLILDNAEDVFRAYIVKEENRKKSMLPIAFYAEIGAEEGRSGKGGTEGENDVELVEFDDLLEHKIPNKVRGKGRKEGVPPKRKKIETTGVVFD